MLTQERSLPFGADMDALGYPASDMSDSRELHGDGFSFYRRSSSEPTCGRITSKARGTGFMVAVAQSECYRRNIAYRSLMRERHFRKHAVFIRDLAFSYIAEPVGAFDFILMEISQSYLTALADAHGWERTVTLACNNDHIDPVLSNLLRAALPDNEQQVRTNEPFVDHLGSAIGIYLLERYSGGPPRVSGRRKTLLSQRQLTSVKNLMLGNLDDVPPVEDLANACGLSRGYFIHAFKQTTGLTPHQWIQSQRIERARNALVNTSQPLAEIALECGFSDQSHFTRVFSKIVGSPPGNWRRHVKDAAL